MKLNFIWMAALINKIVAVGVMKIHKTLLRRRYIPKKLLFGGLYGHISSEMKAALLLVNGERYGHHLPKIMANLIYITNLNFWI